MSIAEKTSPIRELIGKLKKMNVLVKTIDGDLDIEAPEHALTEELLNEIKVNKQHLIEVINAYQGRQREPREITRLPEQPGASYALSSPQRRIWILSQFEAINVAYNMPGVYEFKGGLDVAMLQQAFAKVIDRHETLRTVFREDENQVVHQFIKKTTDTGFEIRYVDLRHENNSDNVLSEALHKLVAIPFDLTKGPLLCATLFRLEATRYIFFFNMHHIISDGWSMGVLIRDVLFFYNALLKGTQPRLEELRFQYKDYAAWQWTQLSGDTMNTHRSYWVNQFNGEIPKLDLPMANVRPPLKTNHGAMVAGQLHATVVSRLREMIRPEGGTLFMGLLAGVKALLYRYSGQDDIVVGSPVAGRDHNGLDHQIGFYINTLALRTRFSGAADFKTLYRQVKEVTLAGFKHQLYPFDELVDELNLKRDLSRSALFDVMVAIQNNEEEERTFKLGDVEISQYPLNHITSKFDLIFNFTEVNNALEYTIEYNTDLYAAESIVRMRTHFENLMAFVVDNSHVPINHIDFLSSEEKNVLRAYNETTIPYPSEKTLIDLFEDQVAKTPHHVALIFDNQTYTYQDLHEKAVRLAHYLNSKGDQVNRPIPIVAGKSAEQIWGVLGILMTGAHYIPIKGDLPEARINELILQSEATVVLVQSSLSDKVHPAINVTLLDESIFLNQPQSYHRPNSKESDLAYIIFTSGSTGKPKGVMIDHRGAVNTLYDINARFGVTGNDVVFGISDLSFDLSVYDIFGTFAAGATLVLPKDDDVQDPEAWLNYVATHKITVWDSVPQLVNLLIDAQGEKQGNLLTSLRLYFMSGDWIPVDLPDKIRNVTPHAHIIGMGGATEGSIWSIYYPIGHVDPLWKSIPYGFPLGNQEMYVLNDALEPCPFLVPGHIFIGGKGVAKGYHKDEQKTGNSFIDHPVLKCPLYRTGDYGVFHPDGYINFLGRLDGQVKIRGYRIEIGEVESVLKNHPDIDQCIVSTVPPEGKDRVLVAYVVSKQIIISSALTNYLATYLPPYMIPSHIVQLDQLPLTANGKVDKKALPDPIHVSSSSEREYCAPQNDIEKQLAEIWSKVLAIDITRISVDDNFFELGGHSLKVTQLKSMINRVFNVQFKINELFTHVSVRDQERLVNASSTVAYATIPAVEKREYYLLSSSQRRLWVLSQFDVTSVAYTIPLAFTIDGSLRIDVLESTLQQLIIRHEILRTVFNTQADGEVYQEIREPFAVDSSIAFFDLQSFHNPEKELRKRLRHQTLVPFDLATGPLLSVSVYQLDKGRQVLFLNMHHSIGDGWSLEVLLKEMLLIYNSILNGMEPNLEKLRIQYKDYAHWQRQQMQSESLAKHKAWWLQQFSGELPTLQLPAAYSRPSVQSHHGAVINGCIAEPTARAFKDLVQHNKATLFMGLIAAVKSLFYRYTGDEDIIIGSPIAGREHLELENQIGLYIGMLALRTRFQGNEGFDRLLQNVREVTLGAYEHQAYPFDELVAELDLKRDTSRSTLFDIVVILHNNTRLSEVMNLSGLTMKPYEFEQATSKFDITFNFAETANGIDYAIEFNTDIYTSDQIERMAAHLQHILESVVADSTMPLFQINYLGEDERHQLLNTFNKTDLAYEKHLTLLDRFSKQVQKTPDATAVVFRNKAVTYAQLQERSSQLAAHLVKCGVRKGDRIGVYIERSEQVVITLLAILRTGAAYVPLDPSYPKERIAFVLHDADIKTILTQNKLTYKLPAFTGNVIAIEDLTIPTEQTVFGEINSNDIAYVIYTSGSTGQPKGVQVAHGNVMNFLAGMDCEIDHHEGDVLLAITTISFDISVLELFWTMVNGIKVVIMPTQHHGSEASEPSLKKMDFSLFYFASEVDEQDKYRLLIEGAKYADQHGFSAVWTPERHFHEFGGIYPNPAITSAAIATITENVQIRAGSCVLPLHNPIRVAEEWSVVDNLSNGRVGLSLASGWVMNDFLAFAPDGYEARYDLLYKSMEQLKSLWKGEKFLLSNPHGRDASVEIFPKPIQKELPVWITAAGSPETFRSAGEKGANLLTHLLGQTIDELKEKIAIYRAARRDAGHVGEGYVTLMIHTFVAHDKDLVRENVKAPFRTYLSNSVGLLRSLGKSIGQDVDDRNFKAEDMNALLDHAFDRYFDTAALFGTPESCLTMVNKLSHAGVNELGCLIDFGLNFETAYGGLQQLHILKEIYATQAEAVHEQVSATELIRKHQVTHLQCTPSALKLMLQETHAREQMASLCTLMVGGEPLSRSLADDVHHTLNVTLHNMYGPTETTVWSTTAKIEEGCTDITIGKPIANTQIYILDPHKNLVPVGVEGEIYIGGDGVTKGYLHRPELTSDRFVENPFTKSDILYRTGDVGKWHSDGTIKFSGRKDDQIKVRGHRIEPGEIEITLKQYEGVEDVVVTAVANKSQDHELVAYVTGREELKVSELRNFLSTRLPVYMIPSHFVQLVSLPLTSNGKINKKALPPVQSASLATGVAYVAPRNKDEERLVEAWAELLEKHKESIGIHDNFFELGGQSLSAIRLMGIISKELHMRIPLSLIFENPTIYEFVGWLNMHQETLRLENSDTLIETEEVL